MPVHYHLLLLLRYFSIVVGHFIGHLATHLLGDQSYYLPISIYPSLHLFARLVQIHRSFQIDLYQIHRSTYGSPSICPPLSIYLPSLHRVMARRVGIPGAERIVSQWCLGMIQLWWNWGWLRGGSAMKSFGCEGPTPGGFLKWLNVGLFFGKHPLIVGGGTLKSNSSDCKMAKFSQL